MAWSFLCDSIIDAAITVVGFQTRKPKFWINEGMWNCVKKRKQAKSNISSPKTPPEKAAKIDIK